MSRARDPRHFMIRLATILVVFTLTCALPPAGGTPRAAHAASFGPQLYLLGPSPLQGEVLPALPATIHAAIYGEGPVLYVASGGADLLARAAAGDIPAKLLDADTSGKVYYFADAQAEGAWDAASRAATILYADGGQLLLALPAGDEPALLEALPSQGIGLALLSPDAIVPEAAPPTTPAEAQAENVDPGIAALLAQLTTQSIADRIAELSGERPADIGGGTATLATRYTFAAGIRNAERYLYQRYVDLGIPVSYAAWSYGSYSGRTVVAELRGTLHPERIWLVGGHFDDISEVPYSRAPGADDNATGTAATLAIAGLLRARRTADTIRFVHFSAEEQGHWGSQAYARSLSSAGSQVMGFLDLDMIGWDGNGDRTVEIHSGTRANSIDLAARFTGANQRYAQGLRVEVKGSSASRFSDHASFWDFGYPAFMAIENFFDDAIPRDRNPWYHQYRRPLEPGRPELRRAHGPHRPGRARRGRRFGSRAAADAHGDAHGHADQDGEAPPPSATLTPTAASCAELAANGGFEANAAWTFAATGNPGGYTAAQARSGLRSARLGVAPSGYRAEDEGAGQAPPAPSGPERNLLGELAPLGASYSTAYQTIAIPDQRAGRDPDFLAPAGHPGGERRFPACAAAQTGELRPHRHGDEDAGRRRHLAARDLRPDPVPRPEHRHLLRGLQR